MSITKTYYVYYGDFEQIHYDDFSNEVALKSLLDYGVISVSSSTIVDFLRLMVKEGKLPNLTVKWRQDNTVVFDKEKWERTEVDSDGRYIGYCPVGEIHRNILRGLL